MAPGNLANFGGKQAAPFKSSGAAKSVAHKAAATHKAAAPKATTSAAPKFGTPAFRAKYGTGKK